MSNKPTTQQTSAPDTNGMRRTRWPKQNTSWGESYRGTPPSNPIKRDNGKSKNKPTTDSPKPKTNNSKRNALPSPSHSGGNGAKNNNNPRKPNNGGNGGATSHAMEEAVACGVVPKFLAEIGLTIKQAKFCMEFPLDFNLQQAAERAGYSMRTAGVIGGENLGKPAVRQGIRLVVERKLSQVANSIGEADMTLGRVLAEMYSLALQDPATIYDEQGRLLNIHDIPKHARICIAGVETEELYEGRGDNRVNYGRLRKVKFWDKNKALEMLGKYHKLFVERIEVDFNARLMLETRVSVDQLKGMSREGLEALATAIKQLGGPGRPDPTAIVGSGGDGAGGAVPATFH